MSNDTQLLSLLLLSGFLYLETVKHCYCHEASNMKCIETERKALLMFKEGLRDIYGRLSTWVGEDCCKWRGVSCSNRTRHVIELKLRNPNPESYDYELSGEINPSLQNLQDMTYLDLSGNNFGGIEIPKFIGSFTKLRYLNLSNAYFGGSIPPNIGNLSSLRYLDLNTYSIESNEKDLKWLSCLSSLNYLNLGDVDLSKASSYWLQTVNTIPSLSQLHLPNCGLMNFPLSLPHVNFTSLLVLDLSNNGFSSTIPNWLVNVSSLLYLKLSSNNLEGNLPDDFPKLALQHLDISHNLLHGRVPNSLKFLKGSTIDLSSNKFAGSFPVWHFNVSALYLRDNQFSGPIPQNIGEVLPSLTVLDISMNSLNGSIPLSIGNLETLTTLVMSNNQLSGEISNIWNKMPYLYTVDLSYNSLSGTIPKSLASLTSLRILALSNNNLSGEVPSSLQNCSDMASLDLGENNLSGNLSSWIGERMQSLWILLIRNNSFSGYIPPQICSLSTIRILDLSLNKLTGFIPPCLGNLGGFRSELSGEDRQQYERRLKVIAIKRIHKYYQTLRRWNILDLSNNNLSGTVPEELTSVSEMAALNLSGNHLTGRIPERIGDMEMLESLDLSRNNFSGAIPQRMASIIYLSVLDLSYNNLSGKIPTTNQFSTFSSSSYQGNLALCGVPLPTDCPENNNTSQSHAEDMEDADGDELELLWSITTKGLGFVTGFWGVCGTLIIKRSWRLAYFQFMNDMKERVFVFVLVSIARLQRKIADVRRNSVM